MGGSAGEMPGRAPDMSAKAAAMMRAALGQIEAASALMANKDNVVKDIANPGSQAILGGGLTQTNLKRVSAADAPKVKAMVEAVSVRLLGNATPNPSPADAKVWAEAAKYLCGRVHVAAGHPYCPSRAPDMSAGAAAAMKKVLGDIEGAAFDG